MDPVITPSGELESTGYEGPRVRLCQDGKYRWTYEFNMLKNPAIILVVYKIFGVLLSIPFLINVISLASKGELQKEWNDRLWSGSNPKVWLVVMAVFAVLILISYLIIAWMYGGKYIVHFTLDEQCVIHDQEPAQVQRARKLGLLTVLVGILAKRPSTVGAGMLSTARTTSTSDFANVRRIKPRRLMELIKVNKLLDRNQVYVPKEDFDFVLDFIRQHCPKAK
ncbi:MAG: hypothetical protein IJU34_03595 [Bacteroidales bacterium]|nr:hypothetical protein [Bacteroidales bacterium]